MALGVAPGKMLQIDGGHFCAGVQFGDNGSAMRAAPILRYMLHWNENMVRDYAARRGWSVVEVPTGR